MKLLPSLKPSVALYQSLLILYPKAYRHEYGPHMVQVFADLLHDASKQGVLGVVQIWLMTVLDLVKTVIEERSKGGIRMTKAGFTLLSSFLLMVAGVFWLPVGYGQFEQYWEDPFGGPDILFEIGQKFMGPAMLLVALGLLGFSLHYSSRLSAWAKASLRTSNAVIALVAILGIAGDFSLLPKTWEWAWYFFLIGMIIHLMGIFMLGIYALRHHLLPRFNAAFLLISLPLVVYMLVGLIYELIQKTSPPSHFGNMLSAASMIAMGIGWFLIGFIFFRDMTLNNKLQPSL